MVYILKINSGKITSSDQQISAVVLGNTETSVFVKQRKWLLSGLSLWVLPGKLHCLSNIHKITECGHKDSITFHHIKTVSCVVCLFTLRLSADLFHPFSGILGKVVWNLFTRIKLWQLHLILLTRGEIPQFCMNSIFVVTTFSSYLQILTVRSHLTTTICTFLQINVRCTHFWQQKKWVAWSPMRPFTLDDKK